MPTITQQICLKTPENETYLLYYFTTDYDMERLMKYSEFRRWLLKQGAEITPGKGLQ